MLPAVTATLSITEDRPGEVTVVLNRPEVRNAFDEAMIADLTAVFTGLGRDPGLRAVILRAAGSAFSAGGDLTWMQRMATFGDDENVADAVALARMLAAINDCPAPVIGMVQGAAMGGGVGLVSVCDVALASEAAKFALSEVRLGLIPGAISPYVMAAIGPRACRRYFLTGEVFGPSEALRLGLVHQVVPPDELDAAADAVLEGLRRGGPQAQRRAKALIRMVAGREVDEAVIQDTARAIADARASDEGQEGVRAFLEKRPAGWIGDGS